MEAHQGFPVYSGEGNSEKILQEDGRFTRRPTVGGLGLQTLRIRVREDSDGHIWPRKKVIHST